MHGSIGGCWGGDDHGEPEYAPVRGNPAGLSPADLQRNAKPAAYLTRAGSPPLGRRVLGRTRDQTRANTTTGGWLPISAAPYSPIKPSKRELEDRVTNLFGLAIRRVGGNEQPIASKTRPRAPQCDLGSLGPFSQLRLVGLNCDRLHRFQSPSIHVNEYEFVFVEKAHNDV